MSKYADILGHEPTAATVALVGKISAYLERIHAERPEIPVDILWSDLKRDLEAIIKPGD